MSASKRSQDWKKIYINLPSSQANFTELEVWCFNNSIVIQAKVGAACETNSLKINEQKRQSINIEV